MDGLTIVTGGAGFLGSHLVDQLVAEGRTVRVVERPGAPVDHLPDGRRDRAGRHPRCAGRAQGDARGHGTSSTWRRTRTCGCATAASSTR